MPLRSWRRLHGGDLVGQVDPIPGFGTWGVSVWAEPGSAGRHAIGRRFELLNEAQAAADQAVRQHFNHRCDGHACSEWLPWIEADESDRLARF
jgi:hypothetical protein